MWKELTFYRNNKKVGEVWYRPNEILWKWGYSGGFVASTKAEAMRQVERM